MLLFFNPIQRVNIYTVFLTGRIFLNGTHGSCPPCTSLIHDVIKWEDLTLCHSHSKWGYYLGFKFVITPVLWIFTDEPKEQKGLGTRLSTSLGKLISILEFWGALKTAKILF